MIHGFMLLKKEAIIIFILIPVYQLQVYFIWMMGVQILVIRLLILSLDMLIINLLRGVNKHLFLKQRKED